MEAVAYAPISGGGRAARAQPEGDHGHERDRSRDERGDHAECGTDRDDRDRELHDDHRAPYRLAEGVEASVQVEQLGGAAESRGEQHRQPAHEAEQDSERKRGDRPRGERAHRDGEEHRRRHDVRGDAGTDLPSEPAAVDPRAVAAEPVFVDLAEEERRGDAEHAGIDGRAHDREPRDDPERRRGGHVDRGDADGEQRHRATEHGAPDDRADDEPRRGRAVPVPRDASPTGVSCESIDCPHGDHVERIAAATATKAPSTRTVVCTPGIVPGRNSAAPAIVDNTTIRSRPGGEMRHLAQNPDPDHGDVLVDDDLEQYEVEVARLDPELLAWLERGTR